MNNHFIQPMKLNKHNPESVFKQNIKKYLTARGWDVLYVPSTALSPGWPDLMLLNKQLLCAKFVEVKTPVNKLEVSQIKLFTKLSAAGVKIWVVEGDHTYNEIQIKKALDVIYKEPNWHAYIRTLG